MHDDDRALRPMLARLERELPAGGYLYEPKWDGFRCLAFRRGGDVELRSRHGRPLGRYFPELVEALARFPGGDLVLDGEVVALTPSGLSFPALLARLHPARSRVERLRRETPALLVAFDLPAAEGDLRDLPFAERRSRLEGLLRHARRPLALTPLTDDPALAEGWLERFGGGIDGVVAKHRELPYRPGKRAMVKVKRDRTADCVVAGFRWLGDRPLPSSLLLGLWDEAGALQHVGVVVSSFPDHARAALLETLASRAVDLAGHPWEHGFLLGGGAAGRLKGAAGRWTPDLPRDWVPVRPELVVEVAYDRADGGRLRHPARFRRWRPDRDPATCSLDQLAAPAAGAADVLAA